MLQKRDRAAVLAEAEGSITVQRRAEQMFRERLAAQIKHGLITQGQFIDYRELRRGLEECRLAAVHAIDWERDHPGQQWMPIFTAANRADGLSERCYHQYLPPASKDL